ncbi:myosin tail-domain-containing protein [Amylocystis lapponica]|nr:myosin tail-domain-containing protein [Amylocystis lapponica]
MARTATEYSNMIKTKETDIARLISDLDTSKSERGRLMKQIIDLQGKIDVLTSELDAQQHDRKLRAATQSKLQEELDELRSLLEAKTNEETLRSEVEKSKEQELTNLRAQASQLSQELDNVRRDALEGQNKLKVELDSFVREHNSLQQSHKSLSERERASQAQLKKTEAALSEAEKARRALESELQSLRSRQMDTEDQLADIVKAKEALERHLATAQSRYADFEDTVLQLERDKSAHDRQMEAIKKQLDTESAKRTQLEHSASTQKAEIIRLKDHNVKLDRDLNKALTDLKAREWDVKQLEARQDKTIVEHVHVLEEAKRVTDRQLLKAQEELKQNEAYIRSLEKAKSRFMNEAEDLVREKEQEQVELRVKEKKARAQEQKANQALAELEKERRAREAAELHIRRLQSDLQSANNQVADVTQQMYSVQKAKDNLELELTRLADETDAPNSVARLQRQYESRISQLESQLEEVDMAKNTTARIKEHVDRQHAEIRRLIMSSGPKDESFRTRLLKELQLADEELERDMSTRFQQIRSNTGSDVRTLANATPTKRSNGISRVRKDSAPDPPRTPDRQAQVNALKQQVQILELQMAASTRVRQYLETSLREMTAELENSDGSKQSLEQYRAKLSRENTRLAELLEDEAEARRAAEAAQLNGVQAMWDKFQSTILEEREGYTRLEESRKALLVQQRTAQVELEDQRRQVKELMLAKKDLLSQVSDLKDRLDAELVAKNDELSAKRQLQMRLQDLEITSSASSTIHSEMTEAVEMYKLKSESLLKKVEEAEIARVKTARAESYTRRALADAEKAQMDAVAERKAIEGRMQIAEERVRDLEAKLDEEGRDSSDMELLRQRLSEEMEDERKQHQEDLAERDFTADQTRKKYQAELAQLSEELQSQRDTMSRLREENRKIRSDHDELLLRYDDEVYNGGSWKKDRERLETKIQDITKAYDSSTAAQAEQQSQIVSLHSQVRELRSVLNDAEADRTLLQKARRALQAELESIKLDHVDTSKMTSETELQRLRLEKQDLERSLEEHNDRVTMAFERMKKAEGYANECQVELGKIRVENSELDKLNAILEKQVKELNVRIVDLETRSLNSPRPATTSRRLASRIDELQSQLDQSTKEKSHHHRTSDKSTRDAKFQLAEAERQRVRLEEEVKSYESKIVGMRQAMDELQTSENNLHLEKRRAEREAADFKQKALNLEREVERLRSRLERPSSSMLGSPVSSPRK